jgi:hypothetical protein
MAVTQSAHPLTYLRLPRSDELGFKTHEFIGVEAPSIQNEKKAENWEQQLDPKLGQPAYLVDNTAEFHATVEIMEVAKATTLNSSVTRSIFEYDHSEKKQPSLPGLIEVQKASINPEDNKASKDSSVTSLIFCYQSFYCQF